MVEMVLVTATASLLVAALATAFVGTSDRELQLFARLYEVPLTPTTSPLLRDFISQSRRHRLGGGFAAFTLVMILNLSGHDFIDPLTSIPIGYGIGAIIGELRRDPTVSGGSRQASLQRRKLGDYVRPWLSALVALEAVLALGLGAVGLASGDPVSVFGPDRSAPFAVLVSGLLVAVVAAGALVGHRVVQEPEPAGPDDQVAARHAIRSAALVSLYGVLLMLTTSAVGIASATLFALTDSDAPIAVWLMVFVALIGFWTSLRALPRFSPIWRRRQHLPPLPSTTQSNVETAR